MESYENLSSNHQKFENRVGDILNDLLPEHLVSLILSHLPTDEAIRTSILSKRWRNLWTTISHLDFDETVVKCRLYRKKYNYGERCKNFEKYVSDVMLRLNPSYSIDNFSIRLKLRSNSSQVEKCIEKCISSAVERNVKDLALKYCIGNHVDLHCELFDCESLETLRVSGTLLLKIPKRGFVCFPNLKSLSLEYVIISGIPAEENSPCFPNLKTLCLTWVKYAGKDDCVMKLIRNCPLLEDLSIERHLNDNLSNDDMCIPQLTTVILDCDSWGHNNVGFNVQIEAPVKNLTIKDWNPTHKIIVKNLDSLIRARLWLNDDKGYHYQGEQSDELSKILKTVDKVKYLSLTSLYAMDAIKVSNIRLPLFSNLIELEVALGCKEFCVLDRLLHNTVNLQSLVVHKISPSLCLKKGCVEEDGRWSELSHVPKCLLTCLRRVEIICSTLCPCEFEMIKSMLNSAKVLEKLISKDAGFDSYSQLHKIPTFPRASALCQVEFA